MAAGSSSAERHASCSLTEKRDQLLLQALVKFALDRAAISVGGQHKALSRRAQLGGSG
jgi:hypothetical protein